MAKSVVVIVGPTGSGKSEIALRLARMINGELVSCDSMQVYRGMNIGTAKPTLKEQRAVHHHMINLISPSLDWSVHSYRRLAASAIKKIIHKGKIPIVVGGSGLYVKALVEGLSKRPGRKDATRKRLECEAEEKGLDQLYLRLKEIDPIRATQIHPHDEKRIIRALEIFEVSKEKPSHLGQKEGGLESLGFEVKVFGLKRHRKDLIERIENRVDQMFKSGWVKEVAHLKKTRLSRTARFAIGYRQILEFLTGKRDLESTVSEIKKKTRQLAKKQMTWFRADERIHWITAKKNDSSVHIAKRISNRVSA